MFFDIHQPFSSSIIKQWLQNITPVINYIIHYVLIRSVVVVGGSSGLGGILSLCHSWVCSDEKYVQPE